LDSQQSDVPLFEALVKYVGKNKISFHTPGHKHGEGIDSQFRQWAGENIFKMDLTLLPELDSLHEPTGVIREAQKLATEAYGADKTFFLVNGTSGGNHIMIFATCYPQDKIIVPRNAHRSVIAGVMFAGAIPIYIQPEFHTELNIFLNVTPAGVRRALEKFPEARAVLITHPTYHGITANLVEIATLVHRHGKVLLVDEAHGPHFKFHESLPISGMDAGADICVQSTHKIIGGLTQSSMLHARRGRVNIPRLKKAFQLFQTTSPSYLLMVSLDLARRQMALYGRELEEKAIHLSQKLRQGINSIDGFCSFGKEIIGLPGVHDLDVTKVTINVKQSGFTGYQVADLLNRNYNIQVEYADQWNILLLVTFGNREEDIKQVLRALQSISRTRPKKAEVDLLAEDYPCEVPEMVLSPREALAALTRTVRLKDALGFVCAETISPYPPGIPLLVPGERITPEILEYLLTISRPGIKIKGLNNGLQTIKVVRE
jgi:arginine/lysine/ornithine decarboxylase